MWILFLWQFEETHSALDSQPFKGLYLLESIKSIKKTHLCANIFLK